MSAKKQPSTRNPQRAIPRDDALPVEVIDREALIEAKTRLGLSRAQAEAVLDAQEAWDQTLSETGSITNPA
jgi:hypothetical protein